MCGFVGIGNYTQPAISVFQRDAFQNALVADSARGMDGTGVFRISEKGVATWAKAAGNPFDLFRTTGFQKDFWSPVITGWTRWLVGHNRYKTKGESSNKNSHPFLHGDILLAHNGTLRGGSIPELNQFPVDSEAICKSISVRGLDETLQRIDSAYCFVYYDSKAQTLNMIRNKERPMYVGINKKSKLIAFGSEQELIDWALVRNGQYIATDDYEELKEDTLYTWTMDDLMPTMREVKGFTPPKKKSKKGKYREMYLKGEKWVDTGSGVYHKVDQIAETSQSPSADSENNYGVGFPHTAASSASSNYPHSALCVCLQCKPSLPVAGYLPSPAVVNGKVFSTESYLGLKKGEMVNFDLDDYDELTKSSDDSSIEKAYLIQGFAKNHPGFTFKCRIKGEDSLKALLDCDSVKGKIVSILINKEVKAEKGTVYVVFPEPDWELRVPLAPDDSFIPEHAFQNQEEYGS